MDDTLDTLVNKANEKDTNISRVFEESVGGELDFKLYLESDVLYYIDGKLYNRNEAGNFVWAYFLKSHGMGNIISGSLAQGGSIKGGRLDETWDTEARHKGIKYYKERKKRRKSCE